MQLEAFIYQYKALPIIVLMIMMMIMIYNGKK